MADTPFETINVAEYDHLMANQLGQASKRKPQSAQPDNGIPPATKKAKSGRQEDEEAPYPGIRMVEDDGLDNQTPDYLVLLQQFESSQFETARLQSHVQSLEKQLEQCQGRANTYWHRWKKAEAKLLDGHIPREEVAQVERVVAGEFHRILARQHRA